MLFQCKIAHAVDQLPQILDGLEETGTAHDWAPSLQMQIALVVEELVVNAASYGGRAPSEGWIEVRIDQVSGGLEIVIEDNGNPFDPFSATLPDIELDLDSRAIGGLGVHFVREMTEQQSYQRMGNINRVTLFKATPSSKDQTTS
jgi:serine/threonine-protein kinase RsbW